MPNYARLINYDPCCPVIPVLRWFGKGLEDWPHTSFNSFLAIPHTITEAIQHLWGNIVRGNIL